MVNPPRHGHADNKREPEQVAEGKAGAKSHAPIIAERGDVQELERLD